MFSLKCNLASPDLPKDHKIYKILEILTKPVDVVRRPYYWNPECFNLNNTSLYRTLDSNSRALVLSEISDSLLQEAYFIEKAGIAFAAKMIIFSETTQEREMYSHFVHQEANHLNSLRPFLKSTDYVDSPFLQMLTNLIESGDKQCLTFAIQIMLEGYGIVHYKQLADSCTEPTLKSVLDSILKDEAQHYRSGIVLYDYNGLSNAQRLWIKEAMALFQEHVSKGPLRVIMAICRFYPNITEEELITLWNDLQASDQIKQAMDTLIKLTGVKHG